MSRFFTPLVIILVLLIGSTTTAWAQLGAPPKSDVQTEDPSSITIPVGTTARISLENSLSSRLSEVGDEVYGTLDNSVFINGVLALKRGTQIIGHVTQVAEAKRPQKQASMTIVFDKVITNSGELPIALTIKAIDNFSTETKMRANDEGRVNGGHSGGRTVDNAVRGVALGGGIGLPIILASSGSLGAAVAAPAGGALAGVLLSKGNDISLQPGTIFRIEFAKPLILVRKTASNGDAVPQAQQD